MGWMVGKVASSNDVLFKKVFRNDCDAVSERDLDSLNGFFLALYMETVTPQHRSDLRADQVLSVNHLCIL